MHFSRPYPDFNGSEYWCYLHEITQLTTFFLIKTGHKFYLRKNSWNFCSKITLLPKWCSNTRYKIMFYTFNGEFHQRKFCFVFLGLYLQHMEFSRLGVELELQLLAYATAIAMPDLSRVCELHHSSRQCGMLNPLSRARDRTRILMDASWIH